MDLAYITPEHVCGVHEASLRRSLSTYREALSVLRRSHNVNGLALKMQLAQAIEQIELELRRRRRRITS